MDRDGRPMAGRGVSTPYEDVLDPDFLARTDDLIAALTPAIPHGGGGELQWIFYGSRVTGTANGTSDLDLMAIHPRHEIAPFRISASLGNTPVTVYCLSWLDLLADGKARTFGGYFSLKLLSPFVCRPTTGNAPAMRTVAHFLAPFAASWTQAVGARTSAQVLADAHLAFLRLYPDAEGYIAANLRRSETGHRRLRQQARVVAEAFASVGYLDRRGADCYQYHPGAELTDPGREAASAAARFWAFGAVSHDADFTFPDHYRRKAQSKATPAERASVRDVLRTISTGTDA